MHVYAGEHTCMYVPACIRMHTKTQGNAYTSIHTHAYTHNCFCAAPAVGVTTLSEQAYTYVNIYTLACLHTHMHTRTAVCYISLGELQQAQMAR